MLRRIPSLRDERGQTASEYMGMLLLVAVIIGALIASGLPGAIAGAAGDMVAKIKGGNEVRDGGGNNPGGGNPGGGNNPGGDGDDGGGGASAATALATCVSSGKAYGYCLKAFDPARYFVETRPSKALDRIDDATKKILSSGLRPGDPGYQALVDARTQAVNEYLATKPTANNKVLRALNNTKKLLDPRYKDVEEVNKALQKLRNAPVTPPPVPAPNTSSGAPKTPGAANKVLKGMSKFGKGLGVVGTAIGAYSNIKNDGVGKGVTKTAGGLLGGYAAGSVAAAGCAALAVTGIGAIACGVGVLAVGIAGSELGSRAAGWVYDNALAPAGGAIKDGFNGAVDIAGEGIDKVGEGLDKAKDIGGDVAGALNPFG